MKKYKRYFVVEVEVEAEDAKRANHFCSEIMDTVKRGNFYHPEPSLLGNHSQRCKKISQDRAAVHFEKDSVPLMKRAAYRSYLYQGDDLAHHYGDSKSLLEAKDVCEGTLDVDDPDPEWEEVEENRWEAKLPPFTSYSGKFVIVI
jgi:hypothetical protein